MSEHRRDKHDRLAADGAPPRLKIARGKDGKLEVRPDQAPEGVHPETVAEERPPQPDDPRTPIRRNIGGSYF